MSYLNTVDNAIAILRGSYKIAADGKQQAPATAKPAEPKLEYQNLAQELAKTGLKATGEELNKTPSTVPWAATFGAGIGALLTAAADLLRTGKISLKNTGLGFGAGAVLGAGYGGYKDARTRGWLKGIHNAASKLNETYENVTKNNAAYVNSLNQANNNK